MTAALQDERKLIRTWAENAANQVRACRSPNALTDWVVEHRWRLHDLERLAPDARAALQLVISERYGELS